MAKETPELILLDIMLPGEDGYSILARLKSDPATRNIPVILVTARESEFDKVKGTGRRSGRLYHKTFRHDGVCFQSKGCPQKMREADGGEGDHLRRSQDICEQT